MKKYFLKEGDVQQGPFDFEELKARGISPDTQVWLEGEAEPLVASQVDELKELFNPPVVEPPVAATEVKVEEPAEPVAAAATAATAAAAVVTPAPVKEKPKATSAKKGTAWVSWLLTLLVLGGAGFFAYSNMEKGKTAGASTITTEPDTAATTSKTNVQLADNNTDGPDTLATTTTTTTDAAAITSTDPGTTSTEAKKASNNAKSIELQKDARKAEDEKKKKLLDAQNKANADKKKQELAQAALLAKEKDMRNRWPNFIRLGNISYDTKGEGIEAFDVPVYNGTDVQVDKVTIRLEYLKKKEKKIYKTENITISNIPARTTVNGRAPESKKGEKVNVIITGITSRKLHFCYPMNNGNADDPYYCN